MEERPILELKLLRYLRTILLLRNRRKLEKLLRMQKVSEQLVESGLAVPAAKSGEPFNVVDMSSTIAPSLTTAIIFRHSIPWAFI